MSRIAKKRALLSLAAASALGIAGAVVVGRMSNVNGDDAAVESSFSAAMHARQSMYAPPASYGVVANAALAAGRPAPEATSAVRQQQMQSGTATIAKYFTAKQAPTEMTDLQQVVTSESDPDIRNIGAGVSDITFTSVAVSGSSATVEANVSIWSTSQALRPDGTWATVSPANVMAYTATLTRSSTGQWLIDSLRGDYVPGEGP